MTVPPEKDELDNRGIEVPLEPEFLILVFGSFIGYHFITVS